MKKIFTSLFLMIFISGCMVDLPDHPEVKKILNEGYIEVSKKRTEFFTQVLYQNDEGERIVVVKTFGKKCRCVISEVMFFDKFDITSVHNFVPYGDEVWRDKKVYRHSL